MIGDNFECDVKGALALGMKSILLTSDKKNPAYKKFLTASNFSEIFKEVKKLN
jgi:FMN phosphatase YigB (HAD superfamily)